MPSITELPYPILVLVLLGPTISNAQDCEPDMGCTFQISAETNVHQIGTHTIFWPVSTLVTTTKTGRFLVLAGETYEWSTRIEDGGDSDIDSELTLFDNLSTSRLCYGNDPDGSGAFIRYTPEVDQQVFVRVTVAPCSTAEEPVQVVWRCASCEELPEVLVPSAGSTSVACGDRVRLRDPGGLGYYANNVNGHAVLISEGSAAVRLRGSHSMEQGPDRLAVFSGAGTVGAGLSITTGHGFLDYTAPPGQTITVQFESDESVFYSGFDLEVSYIGECTDVGIAEPSGTRWTVLTDPSHGIVIIRAGSNRRTPDALLFDATGRRVLFAQTGKNPYGGEVTVALPRTPGYYFLRLSNGDVMETHRVLVQ